MGTLLNADEAAGPDLAKLPPSPALDGEHSFSEITPKGKHAANAAAGALQMQKELATPSAFSLAAVLRRFAAASKAFEDPKPGDNSFQALNRVADEICQWVLDRRHEELATQLAALSAGDREQLANAPSGGTDLARRGEVYGRIFLAADADFRNRYLNTYWLSESEFAWATAPAALAQLSTLVRSGPPAMRVMLNIRLDEATRGRIETLGPVPAPRDVKAEEVAKEDLVNVRMTLTSAPKGEDFSPDVTRKRWESIHPQLRTALLADAWSSAGTAGATGPSEIYLLAIADPKERAPWLATAVEYFASGAAPIAWLSLGVADALNQVRTELSQQQLARLDKGIVQVNERLADAMGLVKAARMNGVMKQWPIVDAVLPPSITHDHGHLDDGNGNIDEAKRRAPTDKEIGDKNFWLLKLMGAKLLRKDLVDATRAYQRFLEASGRDLEFSYDKYIADDPSGAITLDSVLADAREAAIAHSDKRGQVAERFTTQMKQLGAGGSNPRAPYPATENWQKAIGGHSLWAWANVVVETSGPGAERKFTLEVHLICEDRYNFNPGAADIATQTPDSVNGVFEITGLGKEFMSRASAQRTLSFVVPANRDGAQAGAAGAAVQPVVEPAVDDPAASGTHAPTSIAVPGKFQNPK